MVDWTNIDAAEQLFADILDPNTSEPVLIQANNVLVMPAYRHHRARLLQRPRRFSIRRRDQLTATTAANPLGNYRVEESRLAYRRIIASGVAAVDAKKWWFMGDFRRAFDLHGKLADHGDAIADR